MYFFSRCLFFNKRKEKGEEVILSLFLPPPLSSRETFSHLPRFSNDRKFRPWGNIRVIRIPRASSKKFPTRFVTLPRRTMARATPRSKLPAIQIADSIQRGSGEYTFEKRRFCPPISFTSRRSRVCAPPPPFEPNFRLLLPFSFFLNSSCNSNTINGNELYFSSLFIKSIWFFSLINRIEFHFPFFLHSVLFVFLSLSPLLSFFLLWQKRRFRLPRLTWMHLSGYSSIPPPSPPLLWVFEPVRYSSVLLLFPSPRFVSSSFFFSSPRSLPSAKSKNLVAPPLPEIIPSVYTCVSRSVFLEPIHVLSKSSNFISFPWNNNIARSGVFFYFFDRAKSRERERERKGDINLKSGNFRM